MQDISVKIAKQIAAVDLISIYQAPNVLKELRYNKEHFDVRLCAIMGWVKDAADRENLGPKAVAQITVELIELELNVADGKMSELAETVSRAHELIGTEAGQVVYGGTVEILKNARELWSEEQTKGVFQQFWTISIEEFEKASASK